MKFKIFSTIVFICLITQGYAQTLYHEKYRPQFHFSPDSGWIGDPCGFVHYQNTYHMFWWGKVKSTDLVHFTQQSRFAQMGGDTSFLYFTGSAVVDKNNSASFGKNNMITVYTRVDKPTGVQAQALSYSIDTTYTSFQYYSKNPVLNIGSHEFRDPTVFWYAPSSKWVMVVSSPVERKIKFFSSVNLKNWTWLSDFGPIGAQQTIWECPDFFQLPVDGNPGNKKWVLNVSVGPDHQQYFLGSFNGTTFTLDTRTSDFFSRGTSLDGTLFMGFDGNDYGKWTTTGTSFGPGPFHNATPVHISSGAVSSLGSGDNNTGTLTSPSFVISKKAINFLIGGGNHPNQTCINLIINSKVVRTTTGDNTAFMKWNGWDVSSLTGQTARIQIVDNYSGGDWGHVDIDHIMFSDVLHAENLENALWVDYGSDFYASRSFKDYDLDLSSTTWIGWLSNWEYATAVPSTYGKGFWTIARDLKLKTYPEGIRMTQTPITQLQTLRQAPVSFSRRTICGTSRIPEFSPGKNTYEIDATFTTINPNKFGFNLCTGGGRKVVVGYDTRTSTLYIDRTNCTDASMPKFSRMIYAPVAAENKKIRMRIFVDKSSIEVFTNTGKVVLSVLTYPDETQTSLELFSENCNGTTLDFSAWMLNSMWTPNPVISHKSGDNAIKK